MGTQRVERGIYRTATGYQIKVTVKGVPFNDFVEGYANINRARAVKANAIALLEQGIVPEKEDRQGQSNKSLDHAFDETWKHKWSNSSQGYQKQVLTYWKNIREFLTKHRNRTRIDQVTTKDVDEYVFYLRETKGNSESTINNKLCVVSAMCDRMVKHGVIESSPVISWQDDSRERIRYYTHREEEELYKLAELIHFHDTDINVLLQDFIKVLFGTGMRPWEEARNMQVRWVTEDTRGNTVIRIPASYSKTNKERTIPIHGLALEAIQRQSEGRERNEIIFSRLDYKWHCQRFWIETVRPNMGWGKDEVWYCIRHTYATRLCEAGVNLKVVQDLMGHTNINQTAQYAKATDEAKADAVRQLAGMAQAASQTHYQTVGA